jgi:hypothetical protein
MKERRNGWNGSDRNHENPVHRPVNHTLYFTHSICISSNSEGSMKLPDDGRLLSKYVGASIENKEWYNSLHNVGHFYYSKWSFTSISFINLHGVDRNRFMVQVW